MATIKKAQTGKNVPKGMVESEMFPGKMIPKSKSNYYTGEYSKMVEAGKSSAPKPKGMNFDKKSFDKLPVLKSKVTKKPKAQFGRLVKGLAKSAIKGTEKAAVKKSPKMLTLAEKVEAKKLSGGLTKAEMKMGKDANKTLKELNINKYNETPASPVKLTAEQKANNARILKNMKSGGMLKRADGSYSQRGLWDNIRAAKGSGKKPTAAMLKQEKKIKAKTKK